MLITDQDGEPVELDELDPAGLLAVLGDNKRTARAADRDRMRLVNQWCNVHPARHDPDGVATFDPTGLPGILHHDESLGGQGCPPVAAFAPEPVAAVLGIGKVPVKQLFADTLDLHHRLPRCWRRLERLEVDAWKARRVAQLTHPLSKAAAADVDAALAPVLPSCSFAAIDRAVAAAIATHHPDLLAEKTQAGKDAWDVKLTHPRPTDFTGTSWLEATGDTLALTAFEDRLSQIAADLAANGDTDPLGARKAKAIGILAGQPLDGPEADLLALAGAGSPDPQAAVGEASRARRRSRTPKTQVFVHFGLTDLLGLGADDELIAGRVEGRGHLLETTLQSWMEASEVIITPVLDRPDQPGDHQAADQVKSRTLPPRLDPGILEAIAAWAGNPTATITPVLDLNRDWAVDGHDAPAAMREQVIQTHPTACTPGASSPPGPPTSTTSAPTCPSTTAAHPARPHPTRSPHCVVDITGARPPAAGNTDDSPTTATTGPARMAASTSSPRPAPPSSTPAERAPARDAHRQARHPNTTRVIEPPGAP